MGWRPKSKPLNEPPPPPPPPPPPKSTTSPNSGDLHNFPIPQLVSFLQSSYKKSDFKKVEEILISREKAIKEGFLEQLRSKEAQRLDLENDLGPLRPECSELQEEEVKRGGSSVIRIFDRIAKRRLEAEILAWKSKCDELEARILRMEREKEEVIEISDSEDDEIDAGLRTPKRKREDKNAIGELKIQKSEIIDAWMANSAEERLASTNNRLSASRVIEVLPKAHLITLEWHQLKS